ncbi:MAG: NUDIX domain-containing protein [Caulobacteraceae bacterium]
MEPAGRPASSGARRRPAPPLRELREETGVDAEILGLLDVVDGCSWAGRARCRRITFWSTTPPAGPPASRRRGDDAAEARFWPADEAARLPGWGETRRIIRLAVERFPQ